MAAVAVTPAPKQPKQPRVAGQVTGLSGELFVAAELLKRGLQTSVTFGNAKVIDLFAHNLITKRSYNVQVKALRAKNYFLLSHKNVEPTHVYVFVLLNKPGQPVQYFIVPGEALHAEPDKFGKPLMPPSMPDIHSKLLTELGYEDKWSLFGPNAE